MGVELEDGLVEEGLSKWVTALTEQGISRCVELVLQIRQVHVALVVRDVVLGNFMGRLIIEILKRVDLRGVVEQILAVLAAVEIEGVVVSFGLLAVVYIAGSRNSFFVLRDILGIETGQLGGMFSINSVRTAEAFQGIGILPNIVALNADFAPGANEVVS
ncbi:MAG: hypothetical protein JNM35_12930 [Nitrospira sp.]|nr:hypothetical protein [Nitrospira sp.]